jgi:dienelactone hydrolase
MPVLRDLDYAEGGARLCGVLALPDGATASARPGVVVFHEGLGFSDYVVTRARMLAELGYVALAADLYGDRYRAATQAECLEIIGRIAGRPGGLFARALAAVDALKAQPEVDPARIAAIGYCLGGGVVLELARGGAGLAAVASFHGGLAPFGPRAPGPIRPRVLVCTGAEDPIVPREQVTSLQDELRAAGADWQLVTYGNTRHSFTNPDAAAIPIEGLAYSPAADARSWTLLRRLLTDALSC